VNKYVPPTFLHPETKEEVTPKKGDYLVYSKGWYGIISDGHRLLCQFKGSEEADTEFQIPNTHGAAWAAMDLAEALRPKLTIKFLVNDDRRHRDFQMEWIFE
jgi:hypothetical protein